VYVVIPHLRTGLDPEEVMAGLRAVVDSLLTFQSIGNYITWYYSPMSYAFTRHLEPVYCIYDCMDELSLFLFAPPDLKQNEANLLKASDLVFTGGRTLYEAKRQLHNNIYPFPSSIDKKHFLSARKQSREPADQEKIPGPRIGFYGVLDERLNIAMLATLAEWRPYWHFILIGPVVKIDPTSLPQSDNIHYLGSQTYAKLPEYLAGWDIAMIPFALNESTRFISPTKTPEYLAAGKPVISASIPDVVTPYGDLGLVKIADTPEQFIDAAEELLTSRPSPEWLRKTDEFLSSMSWDKTVEEMKALINDGIKNKPSISTKKKKRYV
jgi:UDP-galactopyranose mutase